MDEPTTGSPYQTPSTGETAMFATRLTKRSSGERKKNKAHLGAHLLEDRSLPAVMPIAPTQALVNAVPPEAGSTPATARAIDLLSVSQRSVTENFSSNSDIDTYEVYLRNNDLLAIDV